MIGEVDIVQCQLIELQLGKKIVVWQAVGKVGAIEQYAVDHPFVLMKQLRAEPDIHLLKAQRVGAGFQRHIVQAEMEWVFVIELTEGQFFGPQMLGQPLRRRCQVTGVHDAECDQRQCQQQRNQSNPESKQLFHNSLMR